MARWKIHRRPKHTVDKDGAQHYAGDTVLASAALVSKEQVRSVVGRRTDWQGDAWNLYDTVSELRFGISWLANACSRARLYVGVIDPDGSSAPIPVDHDDTEENAVILSPLEELGGGQLGQSEMLRRLAIHLNIPGESYLVGYDDPDTDERAWMIASPDELTTTGNLVRVKSPSIPDQFITIEPENSTVLRIWRPHPRYAYYPDSPLMALRQPLRELVDLSAHITATAESRLAGAGILFVPDELAVPTPAQSDGVNPLHADPFTAALIEAMAAPLKNRDSASAVVPLVVRGPASAGSSLQHISFSTEFDARAQELRESAIRRVATGMDMPPEVLTGLGDANHWCVPPDTEIHTPHGWVTYDQLTPGQEVTAIDLATGQPTTTHVTHINTFTATDEPVLHLTGPGHDSLTTFNHRWPVIRDGRITVTTSDDLQPDDTLLVPDDTFTHVRHIPLDDFTFTTQDYTGDLWCPTTGTTTWLARHAGTPFYTGNSAWQVEESAIKLHIEPLLGLICDSLTTHFYQPALRSLGVEAWPRYAIWYDTTDLTLRPNRAPEAENAFSQGVISEDAYRRELGFADEDAPDDQERRRQLLTKIALAQPQLAPFILRALGIELPGLGAAMASGDLNTTSSDSVSVTRARTTEPDQADDTRQRESPPDTPQLPTGSSNGTTPTAPTRSTGPTAPPTTAAATPTESVTWRTRCLEMAVIRALERAGQFLIRSSPRSQRDQLQKIKLHMVHTATSVDPDRLDEMLNGAYKEFKRATPGEDCLHQAVDHYVRALLLASEQHRTQYLDTAITQFGCDRDHAMATAGTAA